MSNSTPPIQPPSAMPTMVDDTAMPTRKPASLRREVLAHDDGVGRHDAALEQAEQRRGEIERVERVVDQVEDQRHALQGRAQQQGLDAADPVGDPARGDAAHDAEAQHQRQHRRAARHAVAEVGAVGDDMDLRHRHGDAAGDAGHDQHAPAGALGDRPSERGEWARRAAVLAPLPCSARGGFGEGQRQRAPWRRGRGPPPTR